MNLLVKTTALAILAIGYWVTTSWAQVACPTTAPPLTGIPTPCPFHPIDPPMSGDVFYCSNPVPAPVPCVTIHIIEFCGGQNPTTTDASGHYQLFAYCKKGINSGTVTPSNAPRTPGSPGINTIDVVAVQRHFLIIGPPLSGCRLAAANVNGDSSIDTIDVVAIQRFFLGFSTGTANVGKYQFSPPSRCYINQSNQDFDTLIFGDVATPFIY